MFVVKSFWLIHMQAKPKIGFLGEQAAADFIVKRGYTILLRNYRKPYGEIDIVAEHSRAIHFIEVKTSKYYSNSAFTPEIRVNTKKARKLQKICETYLRETHVSRDQKWQIDVISVILNSDSSVKEIKLFENAVFERKYWFCVRETKCETFHDKHLAWNICETLCETFVVKHLSADQLVFRAVVYR